MMSHDRLTMEPVAFPLWTIFSMVNLCVAIFLIDHIQRSKLCRKIGTALDSLSFLTRDEQRARRLRDTSYDIKIGILMCYFLISAIIYLFSMIYFVFSGIQATLYFFLWLLSCILIAWPIFNLGRVLGNLEDKIYTVLFLINKARLESLIRDDEPRADELRKQEAHWRDVEERWQSLEEFMDNHNGDKHHIPIPLLICDEKKPIFDENVRRLWDMGYKVSLSCPCEKETYICLRNRYTRKSAPV